MKIAVVTCYKYPDYERAVVLRTALAHIPGVEVIVIKNRASNFRRYWQVLLAMYRARRTEKPDAWLVTFRGYELLPFARIIAGRKPLIFDEFVNPLEVTAEHRQQKTGTLVGWIMGAWNMFGVLYYWLLRHCQAILVDTPVHADYASRQSRIPRATYSALPVSANEALFTPTSKKHKTFTVLYYGSMVPLHGLTHVLEAAQMLKDMPIAFLIVGGEKAAEAQVQQAIRDGAKITYSPRVPIAKLAKIVRSANVGLGGPFGKTLQSSMVVTGKTYQFLAAGVPCIVGKSPATSSFLHKQNSLVVQQADAKAIAQAISWAYEHPRQLRDIGVAGSDLYQATYSNQRVTEILQTLLTRLALLPASEHANKD